MADYKVYEIKQSIFKANDDAADVLRAELRKQHCFLLNLMSSPGSGKTTMATALAEQFPDSIVLHTDDFYLPPARRSPDWAHTPCANMDLTRLRDEALRPAYAGQPVAYRAYSCREGAYLPPAQLPAQPLVILEGSYSHHPLLRPYETLRVFVTCTKAEQTRRLQAREGARYADFAARWVPLEEGYFAQHGVAESADFVVDNTK